ncbi:MAG: O-antigen ligase family protein, partial [Candidatus Omnitrophica bacterium]|nr:O-antigen ligase family protein [Candidatus Omnitrophota bacterium]
WERLMLWKGTINMIKVHPILGFGVNTYSRNFPLYKPPEYPDVRYSHNCYLHMASEIGIVGALLFIVLLITVLILCMKYMARIRPGYRKNLEAGLFAALSGFAINCIVDTHLYSVNLAVFFYMLLGYCYGLSYRNVEERSR